jgi:hypothetical protein
MDNKQQTVSGNGSGKKCSPRQLNGTCIQKEKQQHESSLRSDSNAFVRIKIGANLIELWHFEGERAHFVGDGVKTNVRGLLK